jgi:flagellar assembly factor FliW
MSAMNIDTPNSGSLAVEPDRVIEFPQGLAGFEDYHRYTLFHPEVKDGETPSYFILQSLDDVAVAFNIADPALFGFSYEIKLTDEESAMLDLADTMDAAVVVILLKDELSGKIRANLKAPLILNMKSRRGMQHLFSGLNYQLSLKPQD